MMYIKLLEKYLDFIKHGDYHNVFDIDSDWVLKHLNILAINQGNIRMLKLNL